MQNGRMPKFHVASTTMEWALVAGRRRGWLNEDQVVNTSALHEDRQATGLS